MTTMQNRQNERGSALVLAMVLSVMMLGLILAATVINQESAKQSEVRIDYSEALQTAEKGLNKFLMTSQTSLAQVDQALPGGGTRSELVGFVGSNLADPSSDCEVAYQPADSDYIVRVKSAYYAHRNAPASNSGFLKSIDYSNRTNSSDSVFDIYQVVAYNSSPVGQHDFSRGVFAVYEMRKDPVEIPSALYTEDTTPTLRNNDIKISGQDHTKDATSETPTYTIKMPCDGRLKVVFTYSEAALTSSLYLINPSDESEELLLPTNHPRNEIDRTEWTGNYAEGQELTFFARVDATSWGLGIYDHYIIGHRDPWDQVNYGSISLYKVKSGRTADGNADSYEYMTDASGATYYKRGGFSQRYLRGTRYPDITQADLDQTDIRKYTLHVEDLKGNCSSADWDHDDIVADVYVMPPLENGEDMSYVAVRDDDDTIKFEDAGTCLGEDGALETDVFVITATDASCVKAETKAGNYTSNWGTLTDAGDSYTDRLGFTVTLRAKEGDNYVLCVTSENNWRALSHVTFKFEDGEVQTTANESYTSSRFEGDASCVTDGDGTIPLYESEPRPNEGSYLCDNQDDSVYGLAYGSANTNLNFFTTNQSSVISASDANGNEITVTCENDGALNPNVLNDSKVDVEEVAKAFIDDLDSPKSGVNTYTSFGSNDFGDADGNYTLSYINTDASIAQSENIDGAGVLVINGDLTVNGRFEYHGLVLVLGDLTVDTVNSGKNFFVDGSVLCTGNVDMNGKVDLWYSKAALDEAFDAGTPQMAVKAVPMVWRSLNKGELAELGYVAP